MRVAKPTEAGFLKTVMQLAALNGWAQTHFRPAMLRSGKWATAMQGDTGFPDLVLVRDRVIFVETKTEAGVLSLNQRWWYERLVRARAEVYVWRPSMWEVIERTLA